MVLVTRRDLKPGYQAVQPAHALAEFAIQYPNIFEYWQKEYKNLIVLAVDNEETLCKLAAKAGETKIPMSVFHEPDIMDELTAIALAPCDETYKLTSHIPLALKT